MPSPTNQLQVLDDPFATYEGRRESAKTLLGFSAIYLTGYLTDPPALFHPELIRALESDEMKRLLVIGFPVFTNRWLPATTVATQTNTPFMIFGNMKACAFGDKGEIRVGNFSSGSFGGKEIALADQSGIVYKHRHAFVVVLPKAFTVVYTAAS